MFVSLKGKVPVLPESKGLLWLDLVPRYRHLGSLVSHDGRVGPEIRHRLALAGASFREGKRKLFSCKQISIQRRAVLFRSHVLSVLMVGAGSWPLLGTFPEVSWGSTASCLAFGLGATGISRNARSCSALACPLRVPCCTLSGSASWGSWPAVPLTRSAEYQAAVREAGSWFQSIVRHTSSLGPIQDDWDTWSRLMCDQPGKWKGMIRRAEAWDVEVCGLQGALDTAVRSFWDPQELPSSLPVAGLAHGCLLCGLAFASQQQWGAHAQRVHGYRNAAARLAKGRRCDACGSVYASASRLKTHLLYSARCRQFLETASDPAPAASLSGAGHVQAPVVRGGAGRALPSVEGPLLCQDLLASLRALTSADDQDIYDIVASHVEPLPVLRASVEAWVSGLPAGPLASAGSDVLLVLHPEHLCSRVCGKLPDQLPRAAFVPRIVAPVRRPPSVGLPVLHSGYLDLAWVERWSLDGFPIRVVDGNGLASACAACNGVCFSVPGLQCDDASLLSPTSKSLRALRRQCSWLRQLLSLLGPLLRCARRGVPVLLRIPFEASRIQPLSTWLQQTADATAEQASANCFTLEFNARGTSF